MGRVSLGHLFLKKRCLSTFTIGRNKRGSLPLEQMKVKQRMIKRVYTAALIALEVQLMLT